MELLMHVIAFVVGSIAVGRAARLVVHDAWPPMQNLRVWWLGYQHERQEKHLDAIRDAHILSPRQWWWSGWGPLLTCPFCFAPYAAGIDLTWYLLAEGWWVDAWWVVNVWAAVSYVAAMIVLRDEPPEE